jgi:alpha-N-arabinofuranosidase
MAVSQTKVTVRLDQRGRTISSLLHGFSLEHLGRMVYGGVWIGKGSGYSKVTGHRTNLVNALRHIKPGIIKWPGGPFANNYCWEDGTGPVQKRPLKPNTHWGGVESNQFGTDEFLRLCEKVEAEPYICLNTISGSIQQAIGWLSYCNLSGRHKSGSDHYHQTNPLAPKVRYWKIGGGHDETDNSFDPIRYANLLKLWGSYLKQRDPFIQLVVSIIDDQNWIAAFFKAFRGHEHLLDYFSLKTHFPTEPFGGIKPTTKKHYYGLFCYLPLLENRMIRINKNLELYAGTDKKNRLVLDSWGIEHDTVRARNNPEQVVTLRDSLFAACILHLFYRFSDSIGFASLNYLANACHTLFFTKEETLIRTPTYHIFDLMKDHIGAQYLKTQIDTSKQRISNHLGSFNLPLVDVLASWNDDTYTLTLTMINLSFDNEIQIKLSIHGGSSIEGGTAISLRGESPNDQNNIIAPDRIHPRPVPIKRIDNPMRITLSPHSLTKLRLQIR